MTRLSRQQTARRWVRLAMLASALAAGGCSGNKPGAFLTPTGIRPAPVNPTGDLAGFVVFDPQVYPGLDQPPFPHATVQLLRGDSVLASTTVGGASRQFVFSGLPPGVYSLVARSHAFTPGSLSNLTIASVLRDIGDIEMLADTPDSLASNVWVIGTMPGYGVDNFNTLNTFMADNAVGLWTYPASETDVPMPVPAGTWSMKFVTDGGSDSLHLIGWGGDSTQVLEVPISNAPLRFGSDPATDLKIHFPTTGSYFFSFDERRLTMSIRPLSPMPGAQPRRGSRAASRRIR